HFPKNKNFWGKPQSYIKAVDDISLTLKRGHTLGIVGVSGSGKSTLGFALLRLLNGQGKIAFDGTDISTFTRHQMLPYRRRMQVVFQDPFSSLSPRMSVAEIIGEG